MVENGDSASSFIASDNDTLFSEFVDFIQIYVAVLITPFLICMLVLAGQGVPVSFSMNRGLSSE